MTNTIVLVCDAGPTIGSGHVMRMLTLGESLRRLAVDVILSTRSLPPLLLERANLLGVRVIERVNETTNPSVVEELLQMDAAAIVIDSYRIPTSTISSLASLAPLVLVDDNGEHADATADILLNQNLHAESIGYGNSLRRAQRLLGPRWALVRPEVTALRGVGYNLGGRSVLVALGGTDPLGLGTPIVSALMSIPGVEVIHASGLVGSAPFSPDRMATALATATAGVIACGTTTWEAACLGLPFVGVVAAKNQSIVGDSLRSSELASVFDVRRKTDTAISRITSEVVRLLDDPPLRKERSARLRALVDGRGADRVASAIVDLVKGRAEKATS